MRSGAPSWITHGACPARFLECSESRRFCACVSAVRVSMKPLEGVTSCSVVLQRDVSNDTICKCESHRLDNPCIES